MPGQRQRGLEEFSQWPTLRNGVDRLQIRSEAYLNEGVFTEDLLNFSHTCSCNSGSCYNDAANHRPKYSYRIFDFISLTLLVNKTLVNMEAPVSQCMDGTSSNANARQVCWVKCVI